VNESGRDLDALFERDADSRLLERRRTSELGLVPQAPSRSRTPAQFGAESIRDEDAPVTTPRPAGLSLTLDARPQRELIPGALVTLVAAVANDGELPAKDVRVRLALPLEAEAVAGSFARDEIAIDGEALLGEGLMIGTIAPGAAARVRLAAQILPGTEPLDVIASAFAPGVPSVGAPTLRLHRRAAHMAYAQPKPFYELEDGEVDEELAAGEDVSETHVLVDAVSDALAVPAVPPDPAPEPEPDPEPSVETPQPLAIAVPAALLTRAVTGADVRSLDRIFSGGVSHGLAALAVLTTLACDGGPFGEALGLTPFRAAVAAALPRALVAARMRKPTPPVVTRDALAAIRAEGALPTHVPPAGTPALLVRLDTADVEALRAMLRRDLDDAFLRGTQVLVAILARELDGVSAGDAQRCSQALSAFRVTVGAWLMRVTVRRSVDRRYDPLTAEDAALRDAGATLVSLLREVLS
jgi:hypothetical protein